MKRKFKIEDIDEYQTKSTDLIEICRALEIDTITAKDIKSYIIDQILNHYSKSNNNSNNNNNQDTEQQQQDNKRIYTEEELSSLNKQRVITICKDLKIEYLLIQYIMVYQKTEVTPSSLSGGYSLPWSIIASILTQAWNDAKYCTCIYPKEVQDLQEEVSSRLHLTNAPVIFQIIGKQFNSKIGQYTDQVKSNNQRCPQHAMFYRDDSLIPTNDQKMPRAAFEQSVWNHINNQYNGIKVANRIYIPHSNQVYLDAPPWFIKSIEHLTFEENALDKCKSNSFFDNLLKLVNLKSIVLLGYDYLEVETFNHLTSISVEHQYDLDYIEELVESLDRPITKLLMFYPSAILKARDIVLESVQVISLDVNTYKGLFQNNNNNTSQQQQQQQQQSPRNLPNLRHVHFNPNTIQYRDERANKHITDFILPDTITTVSVVKCVDVGSFGFFSDHDYIPKGEETIYGEFLEKNPHITSLRLKFHDGFRAIGKMTTYLKMFETIGKIPPLLKQSKLSRIMVHSDYALTTIQHKQLIQSNLYFNSSKDIGPRQKTRKFIFYRNGQQNNQIINNIEIITTTTNNNNNITNNNNNNNIILPTLPNHIINQIIKLLWTSMNQCNCDDHLVAYSKSLSSSDILLAKTNGDFESTIQSNCKYHCWSDRSIMYLPLSYSDIRRHNRNHLFQQNCQPYQRQQDLLYLNTTK
ncbi:hypothetical protein DFA_09167 [Cavenderia fasciculata]|uniref:Uncharacterized protein n=1 Tax=Cavenderia fasciculata TaxID=261658 RepID=F4Q6W0_CACFS|nr:uncharacterized protein DFA_09167 [Cavenderia fasciculata]EGG16142.1 hypothetical protein DFA_09167 [Cavenderia fasciculata]|eukprot:XP_004352595.1 hypothetical protein DFA_09167 [Cavenderia fasciculata]